jgi:hypothetical protein
MSPSDDGRGIDLMKEEIPREEIVGKNGRIESPLVCRLVMVFEESTLFDKVIRDGGGKKASWEAGTRLKMYGSGVVEVDDPLSSCCECFYECFQSTGSRRIQPRVHTCKSNSAYFLFAEWSGMYRLLRR